MRRLALAVTAATALALPTGAAAPAAADHRDRFPETIALPDGWQPEGIDSGRGTEVFVGSLAGGGIWRGDVRTGTGRVLAGPVGTPAVGLDYDRRGDRLFVAGGPSGQVKVHAARTGRLLGSYPVAGSGFLNDVVVTRAAAYVTDSQVQRLVVVPLGRGGGLPAAATTLPLTGDLVYQPGFNLNGIVAADGGRTLISVQSGTGKLFAIDAATGVTDEIELSGGDLVNGDGLELRGRTLYAVQNRLNRVAVVRLAGDLGSGVITGTITAAGLDVPSTATLNAGYLWAVNARFGTPPTPTTAYAIIRLPRRAG